MKLTCATYRPGRLMALAAFVAALALPACLLGPVGPEPGCSGGYCGSYSNGDPCSGYGDPTSCEDAGCYWSLFCDGAATPCAYLSGDNCDQQAGCAWDSDTGVCGGSEGPCEAFAGTACGYQIGCEDTYGCTQD